MAQGTSLQRPQPQSSATCPWPPHKARPLDPAQMLEGQKSRPAAGPQRKVPQKDRPGRPVVSGSTWLHGRSSCVTADVNHSAAGRPPAGRHPSLPTPSPVLQHKGPQTQPWGHPGLWEWDTPTPAPCQPAPRLRHKPGGAQPAGRGHLRRTTLAEVCNGPGRRLRTPGEGI